MREELEAPLRSLGMVVAMILAGSIAFLVVALLLGPRERFEGPPIITYLALGAAVIALGMRATLPGFVDAHGARKIARGSFRPQAHVVQAQLVEKLGDEGRLFLVFQTRTILATGPTNGASLFACAAYLWEGQVFAVAVVVLLAIVGALGFPTRGRWEAWKAGMERRAGEGRAA
jgi:hypothetical protein